MKGNKKVIEYLNKALKHELTAVNQYWLHYRLLDNWGYKELAKVWRKESIEEMVHADKLIERIIFLDGAPNMQTLESLDIGKTVKAVLDNDLQAELSAHSLYAEAATHCHSVKDYVTRDLFERLIHDEEEHIDFWKPRSNSSPGSALSCMPSAISENSTNPNVVQRPDDVIE
jgi:bacterioferritin